MKRTIRGAIKVASSLGLAGGILVAAALPAAAASPNRSNAVEATGLISVSPQAEATFPGTSPVTVANINLVGLVSTGVVTDTAGATSASSHIDDASAPLTRTSGLSATTITSSCSFNTNTAVVSGTASITGGVVKVLGVTVLTLASNPAPNTTVTVPGVATITLNRQTTALDGTLTVNAIYVSLLGSTQTLALGTSVCNAANLAPVPILPGKALGISLGGLGLLLAMGASYRVNKRRRVRATA
jgi:hypothetical protein